MVVYTLNRYLIAANAHFFARDIFKSHGYHVVGETTKSTPRMFSHIWYVCVYTYYVIRLY